MTLILDPQTLAHIDNCVRCGLCLPKCPTYQECADENDSPRGRIYLIQALAEGRARPSTKIHAHLDSCLDCRACETACPSGVQYGALIEAYRTNTPASAKPYKTVTQRLRDWLLFQVLPYRHRTRWLLTLTRLLDSTGLFDFLIHSQLFKHTTSLHFAKMLRQLTLPSAPLPQQSTPAAAPRQCAHLFIGCVNESITGQVNRATHRVLLRNDCAVHCPANQQCCGAIHYHAGEIDQARKFARENIDAFEQATAIVVNAAGCGLMLKQYGQVFDPDDPYHERAVLFSRRVVDIHEFLLALPLRVPADGIPAKVAYHDACHLVHGQGIATAPRKLLHMIPNLELVTLQEADWCCGAAGSYSLTHPDMATRLANRKLQHIDDTDAEIVAAANVGCSMHLQQNALRCGTALRVAHPIELLDRAYNSRTV